MSPGVQHFLLGLWLVVGGLVSVALCVAVGMRNGFHIRRQVHRKSGVVTDSTLKWFVIIGALFMGPPAAMLGVGVVSDALYRASAVMAGFWWVPPALFVVAAGVVVGWHFLARKPTPPPAVLPPVPVGAPGEETYRMFGDGGYGTPPARR